MGPAVEEVIRWSSPVSYFARRATRDTEIRGVPIATAQYGEPWARQQDNSSLAISRDRARLCSETIREMLGY